MDGLKNLVWWVVQTIRACLFRIQSGCPMRTGQIGPRFQVVCEDGCEIEFGSNLNIMSDFKLFVSGRSRVFLGDRCSINTNVHISVNHESNLDIGSNCLFGPNVVIRPNSHRFDSIKIPIRDQGHTKATMKIGNDVWIGANATVVGDITIGEGAVIAAGAVVVTDIPPFQVWGGVPARKIKDRGESS
jgi:acetyltransferase-like isoleucine patch superfamily enzyme